MFAHGDELIAVGAFTFWRTSVRMLSPWERKRLGMTDRPSGLQWMSSCLRCNFGES